MTRRGKFITFEGLDGCGKSTQLQKLASALRAQDVPVTLTREPGGTPTGEKIRSLLLDTRTSGLAPLSELALMFAARAQHIKEIIEPALAQGRFVICDRFTDSTEAYQGGGRQLGSDLILALHRLLCNGLQPDLTILMDSDVGVSVQRARKRNDLRTEKSVRGKPETSKLGFSQPDENRFEHEGRAFFDRVHDTYLAIAAREPSRVAVVNARGTPQETHQKIIDLVRSRMNLPMTQRSKSLA
jgi:dTMP kinase